MKNHLLLSLVAASFGLSATTASAQNLKIGTVDMKKVFESYYKTKDAEAKINEARNSAKKELEDRMDVAKKVLEEVKKLDEEIASELQGMDREIREFQQNREKQLQEQSVRMRSGIVEEINKVVDAKVKSEQFDLVLDKSGPSLNGVPVVLFSRDTYEFTPEVITALNKNKSSDTSATDAPAKPAAPATPAPKKK
jgi:outer membrane protein